MQKNMIKIKLNKKDIAMNLLSSNGLKNQNRTKQNKNAYLVKN